MSEPDWSEQFADFGDLEGKVLASVTSDGAVITFVCEDGETFTLAHEQDCCESIDLIDINGDLADLVGEVLGAEQVTNDSIPHHGDASYTPESYTWTFCRVWTIKGTVVLRWYGTSNGYYCEMPSMRRKAKGRAS